MKNRVYSASLLLCARLQRQSSHLSEETDNINRLLRAAQFPINGLDIHRYPLTIRPRGIAIQRNIFGSLSGRHARLVALSRFLINIFKIALDLSYSFFIRNRAMTGRSEE